MYQHMRDGNIALIIIVNRNFNKDFDSKCAVIVIILCRKLYVNNVIYSYGVSNPIKAY
jgi:hypothetical protein